MKFRCPKCGTIFEEGVAACPGCGQPFKWPTKQEVPATVPAEEKVEEKVEEKIEEKVEEKPKKEKKVKAPKEKKTRSNPTLSARGIGIIITCALWFVVILVAVLTNSIFQSSKGRLTGSWESEQMDFLDNVEVKVESEDPIFKYFYIKYEENKDLFPVMVYYNLEFSKDGTFNLSLSSKDFELAAENVAKGIYNGYFDAVKNYFVLNNKDKTKVESFLSDCGFTEEFFMNKFKDKWKPGVPLQSGTWEVDDTKLYLTDKDGNCVKYSLEFSGDTVTIPGLVGTGKFTKK